MTTQPTKAQLVAANRTKRIYRIIQETGNLLAQVALIPVAASQTIPDASFPDWLITVLVWCGVVSLAAPFVAKWWLGVTDPTPDTPPEQL